MMRPIQPSTSNAHFNMPSGLLQDSVLMFTHVRTISVGLKQSEEEKKIHKSAVNFLKMCVWEVFWHFGEAFPSPSSTTGPTYESRVV